MRDREGYIITPLYFNQQQLRHEVSQAHNHVDVLLRFPDEYFILSTGVVFYYYLLWKSDLCFW